MKPTTILLPLPGDLQDEADNFDPAYCAGCNRLDRDCDCAPESPSEGDLTDEEVRALESDNLL